MNANGNNFYGFSAIVILVLHVSKIFDGQENLWCQEKKRKEKEQKKTPTTLRSDLLEMSERYFLIHGHDSSSNEIKFHSQLLLE